MDHIFAIMKEKGIISPLMISGYYSTKLDDFWVVSKNNTDFSEPSYAFPAETRINSFEFPKAADIWSYGMVLYEILTLTKPYDNLSPEKIEEYAKIQGPTIPAEFTDGELCEQYKHIIDLILACTEIDATKRPTITEITYSLSNSLPIRSVIGKKNLKVNTDQSKSIVPQKNQWPITSENQVPFNILSQITQSPLVNNCPNYVIEAPLPANSKTDNPIILQFSDLGIPYYKDIISQKQHDNYIGFSEDGESVVVVSISAEGIMTDSTGICEFRAILRFIERDERVLVICDTPKDRLKSMKQLPQLQSFKLQSIRDPVIPQKLMEFEQAQLSTKTFKFGIIYRKKGQQTDNEMFSNEEGSKQFDQFLNFIGSKVSLQGWNKFRGGLDVASNTTGEESVYTTMNDLEIMFHVSTLLPYDKENPQQLHRKRHIGNDIVVIVFQDEDADPFDPSQWTSNFNHVFVVVQPVSSNDKQFSLNKSTGSKLSLSLDLEALEETDFTMSYKYVSYSLFYFKYFY